jgi:hypothetical protein
LEDMLIYIKVKRLMKERKRLWETGCYSVPLSCPSAIISFTFICVNDNFTFIVWISFL